MRHLPFVLPLWFVTLLTYLYTRAPSILYIDAGTIVAAAHEPGIPNPPGFPFYIMVAHLFTKLPFGDVLFRVQLLSIVSAIGVLTMLYYLLQRLIRGEFLFVRQTRNDNELFGKTFLRLTKTNQLSETQVRLISLAGTFILAFSYQFWSQTLNTESYIFTNFMMMSLLTFVLTVPTVLGRSGESGSSGMVTMKRLIPASVLLGVASGANPTIAQSVPALIVALVFLWRHIGWKRLIIMGVIAAIFSALVYSYLPLRARGYPFMNWGNPQTVKLFLGHLHGEGLNIYDPRTNSINGFTGNPQIFAQSFGRYVYLFFLQFTPVLTPLIFLGIYYLFKKNRKLTLTLLVVPFTNLVFGVLYLSGNQESWFVASYVIFAFFIGIGLSVLVKVLLARVAAGPAARFPHPMSSVAVRSLRALDGGPPLASPAAPVTPRFHPLLLLLLLLPLLPFVWWFPKLNRHDFIATREYADNLYKDILPNAVLIGSGDFFNQLTHYEYGVTKRRRDVFPVVANMWYILPWYRDTLRHHRPDLMPKELEKKIKMDRLEEYNEVMNWWIRGLVDKGVPVYVTPMVFRETVLAGTNAGKYMPDKEKLKFVNNGLVFRMLTNNDLLQANEEHTTYTFRDPFFYKKPPFYLERNYNAAFNLILREYGASYAALGDYFLGVGNKEKELAYLKKAYEIAPFAVEVVNRLGIYAVSIGDIKAASRYFQEASELDPKSFEAKLNLARSFLALGNEIGAKQNLEAIVTNAEDPSLKFEAQQDLSRLQLKQLADNIPPDWKRFEVKQQNIVLRYPDKWKAQTVGAVTKLSSPSDNFSINIQAGVLAQGMEPKAWAKQRSQIRFPGVLAREGAAQIPGYDATAAFWDEGSPETGIVKVLEFILVHPSSQTAQALPGSTTPPPIEQPKQKRIIHIKISPADSEMMKVLDSILAGITLTN